MSNEKSLPFEPLENVASHEDASFADILSSFEQQHHEQAGQPLSGTVVSVGPVSLLVDVGRKIEGSLLLSKWRESETGEPKPGATVLVSVGPRNEEGYYELSTIRVERPRDWTALQTAFAEKQVIAGVVEEQIKGGFRVDIGVRAFLPASRSGVREADDMPKLVGQEIQCRITKLDTEKEDLVVDRRQVMEEEQNKKRAEAFLNLTEGAVVHGRVRSLLDFGAFIELAPGVDGLLHVIDMSYSRVGKASDLVKVGDELDVKILKLDSAGKKISLGLKQLQDDPWTVASRSLKIGDRISGTVSRLADFGAFVELFPGVDGLIHISELSWDKKVRKPGDLLKIGDRVAAVVLQVNAAEKRIGLGYKQVLGDPWEAILEKHPVGSTVEGAVSNLTPFGAFIDLGGGIEGMIHISDITNEKRLDHPRDRLAKGQSVKAIVIEVDRERRRVKLGMRQLEPTTVDHYISEHQPGETVSGRLVEVSGDRARVELGEGIIGTCRLRRTDPASAKAAAEKSSDVSSLSAMLAARWKQGGEGSTEKELARTGQVRSFKIAHLDASKKLIELEFAS
jgi:small subunit ribosomal protein S1